LPFNEITISNYGQSQREPERERKREKQTEEREREREKARGEARKSKKHKALYSEAAVSILSTKNECPFDDGWGFEVSRRKLFRRDSERAETSGLPVPGIERDDRRDPARSPGVS